MTDLPTQTPLFHAQHSSRYDRQEWIRDYQERYDCNLVVVIDAIFQHSIALFEEVLFELDGARDLHLMLDSPGGDGETAVRLVRSAQGRCHELTVIVPNQAKSAATLLALGAHHILMGPASDLGPVDPQFRVQGGGLVSAKNIIAAVEDAEKRVAENPQTVALHASLLADVSAIVVQEARSEIRRSGELLEEALKSNPDRDDAEVAELREALTDPLIELPASHGAVLGARDALETGLPIQIADHNGDQWKRIWRLYTKYLHPEVIAYEASQASQVVPVPEYVEP